MSEVISWESPMVQVDFAEDQQKTDRLFIREQAFLGHINLRGRRDDVEFTQAVESVLGFALPFDANRCVSRGGLCVIWLGPDEWLLITTNAKRQALLDNLQSTLVNSFSSVCDISSAQTVIEIGGQYARDLIASDCPLDIHPTIFADGCCAQTRLAKAVVTLYKTSDSAAYRIIVRRSFSDYLARWLLQVATNSRFLI